MSRPAHWVFRVASRALLAAGALVPTAACAQQGTADPAALYRTGKYAEAIAAAERRVASDSNDAAAAVVLLRALRDVGRAADAAQAGARLATRAGLRPRVAVARALALQDLGQLDEAGRALNDALAGPDSLTARLELAVLASARGDRAAAHDGFDRFIDIYNSRRASLSARELLAVARACRMLGRDDPQLFKDALRAFDEANARDTLELEGRVLLGEMFLEKFNGADARTSLDEVLKVNPSHPRALLAMARLESFDGRGSGRELVERALAVNPRSAEGHAAAAMQLVDVERYADAIAEAEKGLVDDAGAPSPLVAIAAARYVSGDRAGHQAALDRAHARLTGAADAEVVLADVAARNRLYREAAAFAAAGVARDARSARALALLGINQMRLGNVPEGTKNLQAAFAIDPYDVWVKNTLDLTDTFKDYSELRSPRFVIVAETRDAPLLELFVPPLAELAYDSLSARYGFRPDVPVRVELFRSHADFSVRTVGLAGLGALGVSFGGVVAMDSPAARKVGEFNWGSTLWHEIGHTVTLGMTANRIPRWLSEGLSVYEERRARTGWGSDLTPSLVAAYKAGMLHPVSRLNDGFIRPRYPEEVPLSYALASYVCEMVEAQHGVAGMRRVLQAYKDGKDTPAAFGAVAGTSGEAFDKAFDAWFRQRFANEFRAVEPGARAAGPARRGRDDEEPGLPGWQGPLYDAVRGAVRDIAADRKAEAEAALVKAKAMFPTWAEEGSPYHLLAQLYLVQGDTAKAMAELAAISDRNESAFAENVMLARLRRSRGDQAGAVQALERTLYITPFDVAVHDSLAVVALAAGRADLAVRSRRAILATGPTDRAGAYYELARALQAAGDVAGARREVLRALDLAPNYEKAQELLLTLRKPEAK